MKKNIKLGSMSPTRDFSYVSDTIRGFEAVVKEDKAVGEIINIGSNHEISINDGVKLITKITRVKINTEKDETRVRPEKKRSKTTIGRDKKS